MHGSKKYPSVDIHPRSVPAYKKRCHEKGNANKNFFCAFFSNCDRNGFLCPKCGPPEYPEYQERQRRIKARLNANATVMASAGMKSLRTPRKGIKAVLAAQAMP
ncbi:hypothetical protein [Candidatus Kuenenia stuttgartiensis]|uniref:hypothetical protein n=1 Tax=Kuenenia stuttgartiensis TaxID=174633 RepID=UPI00146A4891|nr:hypothetical protein [Candidatus Kuenenia stuttgartiensis]